MSPRFTLLVSLGKYHRQVEWNKEIGNTFSPSLLGSNLPCGLEAVGLGVDAGSSIESIRDWSGPQRGKGRFGTNSAEDPNPSISPGSSHLPTWPLLSIQTPVCGLWTFLVAVACAPPLCPYSRVKEAPDNS